MSLSSLNLDAFYAVCRSTSFVKAAQTLSVTQSALSQRVQHLEQDLGTTLFIRDRKGIRLTEGGQRLLSYCRVRDSLERELTQDFVSGPTNELAGQLRVGGFSSINRSILLPLLHGLLHSHPRVQLTLLGAEVRTLPTLLFQGEVDFIFLDQPISKAGLVCTMLGEEEYVLVESRRSRQVSDRYLDHDEADQTTHNFFQLQKKRPRPYARAFLDDIYGLLDGVAAGLGRAVVPRHLVTNDKRVKEVEGLCPLRMPVHLLYLEQPYYSRLHLTIRQTLEEGVARQLASIG